MQPTLGLKENWKQFTLLVLVNVFVGGMVGLERTVVPLVGTDEFRIGSEIVIFSFIIAFGVVKAFTNIASGLFADRFSRKRILIAGWLLGVPVPLMLGYPFRTLEPMCQIPQALRPPYVRNPVIMVLSSC